MFFDVMFDGFWLHFQRFRTTLGSISGGFQWRLGAVSGLDPLPMPYQRVITADFNESVAAADKLELHMNPAGQIAGMITEHKPAKQIMEELVSGTIATLEEIRDTVDVG